MFKISTVGNVAATSCGLSSEAAKFEGRVKHLVEAGLIDVSWQHCLPKRSTRWLSVDEACLAALLAFSSEYLDFDIDLQRAISKGARQDGFGGGLRRAVQGVANGERWAVCLNIRGQNDLVARFVRLEDAFPNERAEELLTAYGRPLLANVIIGVTDLFEPFAQYAGA